MTRRCSEPGCPLPAKKRGFCGPHHYRRWKNGTLPPLPKPTAEERFWAKVEKTETCWLWTAYTDKGGYGTFYTNTTRRPAYAHRWAYELLVGPIPAGMELDHRHTCPKNCVNPEHLRPTTPKQNVENHGGASRRSKTGLRGVFWSQGKLQVQVRGNGRVHNGGRHSFRVLAQQSAEDLRCRFNTHNDADRRWPYTTRYPG